MQWPLAKGEGEGKKDKMAGIFGEGVLFRRRPNLEVEANVSQNGMDLTTMVKTPSITGPHHCLHLLIGSFCRQVPASLGCKLNHMATHLSSLVSSTTKSGWN